ncbi:hypothetical protein NA57DRAFT_59213 [Rhizodiscina lignyota]|uniref:P-loop containing nucleoside triphosphate hydrolase protein n=1 Tax=Rhizodiscina lignyota TaxID=1504668 RepID=A0A9P4I706_9PEZI|nr:hypothetical protein NA57DRAFT_59213 [Rhizodiscina lignyota]
MAPKRLIDDLPDRPRTRPMKVLLLGDPRTGTTTLHHTLTELGFHVYHHADLIQDVPRIKRDYELWTDAFDANFNGKGKRWGKREFERILYDYDVIGDIPLSVFVDDLLVAYPDAKVILTNRPAKSWYGSMRRTILRWHMSPLIRFIAYFDHDIFGPLFAATNPCINLFTGDDWRGEKGAMKAYNEHYEHVRRACRAGGRELLEYNQPYEYGPLCEFLNIEAPKEDYPVANSTKDSNALYTWALKLVLIGFAIKTAKALVPLAVVGAASWLALKKGLLPEVIENKFALS